MGEYVRKTEPMGNVYKFNEKSPITVLGLQANVSVCSVLTEFLKERKFCQTQF